MQIDGSSCAQCKYSRAGALFVCSSPARNFEAFYIASSKYFFKNLVQNVVEQIGRDAQDSHAIGDFMRRDLSITSFAPGPGTGNLHAILHGFPACVNCITSAWSWSVSKEYLLALHAQQIYERKTIHHRPTRNSWCYSHTSYGGNASPQPLSNLIFRLCWPPDHSHHSSLSTFRKIYPGTKALKMIWRGCRSAHGSNTHTGLRVNNWRHDWAGNRLKVKVHVKGEVSVVLLGCQLHQVDYRGDFRESSEVD